MGIAPEALDEMQKIDNENEEIQNKSTEDADENRKRKKKTVSFSSMKNTIFSYFKTK